MGLFPVLTIREVESSRSVQRKRQSLLELDWFTIHDVQRTMPKHWKLAGILHSIESNMSVKWQSLAVVVVLLLSADRLPL